ncbi:MAG: ABC transporter ATP-binding protein [Phycisphaerales bacterium JB037]
MTGPPTGQPPLVRVRDLCKTYRMGRVSVPVLRGVNIDIEAGEWVAVLGASGSGKSTLLHLLGGLDRPDAPSPKRGRGESRILYEGKPLWARSPRDLDRYRAREIGLVFQAYHLLPELDVLENVLVGAMIRYGRFGYRARRRELTGRADRLLESVGLGHRRRHRPVELSGGERQRVAIARALINQPAVVLADEPTGNLDRKTGESVLDALEGLRSEFGTTLVLVTHAQEVADRADRVVTLLDGRVAPADPV